MLCLRSNVPNTCTQGLEVLKTIHDVPKEIKPKFYKLCEIAFDKLKDEKLVMNKADFPSDWDDSKFDY